MRLDHIAYRVKNRRKTAKFFKKAFGYTVEREFKIKFNDGSKAECLALIPSEDRHPSTAEWDVLLADAPTEGSVANVDFHSYHAPPEVFVSDGPKDSIVGNWVAERGGVGGIHHIAYQVDEVEETMREWEKLGYAGFYSDSPISCDNPKLTQVFTKPSELTGVIYELISREGDGFCKDSVKKLMESTDTEEN